jgi:transposase-like protein
MATGTAALRTARPQSPASVGDDELSPTRARAARFQPQSVQSDDLRGSERTGLRLYTEQQVSELFQLSRSQLRKWRMGWSRGRREGPPFKRIGRLIRYPESGLRAYVEEPPPQCDR